MRVAYFERELNVGLTLERTADKPACVDGSELRLQIHLSYLYQKQAQEPPVFVTQFHDTIGCRFIDVLSCLYGWYPRTSLRLKR